MVDKYIDLIIEHFNLSDETTESLNKRFSIKKLTKNRIFFNKVSNFSDIKRMSNVIIHESIIKALKKYADENALNKYMENEGYKYDSRNTIDNILASKFLIYPTKDYDLAFKYIKNNYKDYNMWEFETIDDIYSIAYN